MAGRREIESSSYCTPLVTASTLANVHYAARPMKATATDPVVINLRQVATIRMQIRLKFRSLTTDAPVLTGDDKSFSPADSSMRLSDIMRVPPRKRASSNAKVLDIDEGAKRMAPICRLRGCLMNMQIASPSCPKERR